MVKSVFFSYSSSDFGWVEQFKDNNYFVRPLGNLRICDYMIAGQELPFGHLNEWLQDKVNECVAVFAFMSETYLESQPSQVELRAALDKFLKKEIIFVPIILDVAGKESWGKLKHDTKYGDILLNYMYCDFTFAGEPLELFPNGRRNIPAMKRIESLASLVASRVALSAASTIGDNEERRPGKVDPTPAQRAAERLDDAQHPGSGSLVLLGDPANPIPAPEVAANLDALSRTLSERGVSYSKWPHAWRNVDTEPYEKVRPPATFLRIVTPFDIRDEADGPRTLKWINECNRVEGPVDGEVVLWRPGDENFEWQHVSPVLRQDSAEALAKWLADQFKADDGEAPTLLIIDEPQYDALEDAPYSDVVRMVCELTKMPLRGKSMNAEEFSRFIVDNQDRKLIIAVLDNNVNMTEQDGCGPVERFEEILERWQDEIQRINKQKGFEVEVVWVAVVARLAHLYPLSTWNKRTLEPINVLRVFRTRQPSGRAKYEPDVNSASRVARALRGLMPDVLKKFEDPTKAIKPGEVPKPSPKPQQPQ